MQVTALLSFFFAVVMWPWFWGGAAWIVYVFSVGVAVVASMLLVAHFTALFPKLPGPCVLIVRSSPFPIAFALRRSFGTSCCALCRSSSPTSCSLSPWASLSCSTSSTPLPSCSGRSRGPSTSPGFAFTIYLFSPSPHRSIFLISTQRNVFVSPIVPTVTRMRSRQLYLTLTRHIGNRSGLSRIHSNIVNNILPSLFIRKINSLLIIHLPKNMI